MPISLADAECVSSVWVYACVCNGVRVCVCVCTYMCVCGGGFMSATSTLVNPGNAVSAAKADTIPLTVRRSPGHRCGNLPQSCKLRLSIVLHEKRKSKWA